MTEKEKMMANLPYNAEDATLRQDRQRARQLCFEYNNTPPKHGRAVEIMDKLLGKHGNNTCINPNFFCDYGYNIEVGDNFFANYNLVILDCAKVVIGDNVFIAPNVGIYAATHPISAEERRTKAESAAPVKIGSDVWIGGGVSILPGITIGSNCVIGAGSVVVKNIPDNSIAVGNPCKVIRKI